MKRIDIQFNNVVSSLGNYENSKTLVVQTESMNSDVLEKERKSHRLRAPSIIFIIITIIRQFSLYIVQNTSMPISRVIAYLMQANYKYSTIIMCTYVA